MNKTKFGITHIRKIDETIFYKTLASTGLKPKNLTDIPEIVRFQMDFLKKGEARGFNIMFKIFGSGMDISKVLPYVLPDEPIGTGIPKINARLNLCFNNRNDFVFFMDKLEEEIFDPDVFFSIPDILESYVDGVINKNFGPLYFFLDVFEEGKQPTPPFIESTA